jgi:hypothetical protein
MFVINLILIIINPLVGGTYLTIPEGTIFLKAWFVITQLIPFHGVFNLITYILGLIAN